MKAMPDISITPNQYNFSAAHAAMQSYVDRKILAGVSSAVLVGRDLVDLNCVGYADVEQNIALRSDHLFRAFSNTKLVTSCAVMMLVEEARLGLDDPIEKYIPQLGNRKVLKPEAKALDDTEPAQGSITVRHLLSHSSGLSYGLLDPGTLIYKAYIAAKVLNPTQTLAEMVGALEPLPLVFHPGTGWEYSVATDVLSRLVEVVSGQAFDVFIQSRVFEPLGMVDTGFVVPQKEQSRLTAYYAGADLLNPTKPGLTRSDQAPWPGAYLRPVPRLSGGGGLVTSLPDMIAFMRSFLPGGPTLLKPETIALMMNNQLADKMRIGFPNLGRVEGKAFGLGGAITLNPSSLDPKDSTGEFQWGGIAGTHWWISPRKNLVGLLMTQRQMAFWHPFSFEYKQLVYRAVEGA
jgi:CubicO group peptidase (beta-lactamase class C family)